MSRRVEGDLRVVEVGGDTSSARAGEHSWVLTRVQGDASLADLRAWAGEEGALDLRAVTRVGGDEQAVAAVMGFELVAVDGALAEVALPVPLHLPTRSATRALGARLASVVRAGDLLSLSGPLGAGKTALTAGLGAALGVRSAVTSPTFVLARVHPGPLPLVHVDAYRLRREDGGLSLSDLEDLELDARLEDSVTVVEWGSGAVEALAQDRLDVTLERPADAAADTERGPRVAVDEALLADGDSPRKGVIRARGSRWAQTGYRDVTDWLRGGA